MKILDVKIDDFSHAELWEMIRGFLHSSYQHYIATVNPEFLVAAQKDSEFLNILNMADVSVADGFGIILWSKILGTPVRHRITGADMIPEIARIASENNKALFLLGGQEGSARETAKRLRIEFPNLRVDAMNGGEVPDHPQHPHNKELVRVINKFSPDVLLVALGQVRQEKWIWKHLDALPSVKLAMGVGGSFEFLSGTIKRAPLIIRQLGLEWMWRLLQEPRRFRRIWNAVFVFSWMVIQKKFKKPSL